MWQRAHQAFYRLEDGLLVTVFLSMLALAITQIVVRNAFDFSYPWIDPLNRIGVLWIALIGSMIGARRNDHIKIDLTEQIFPRWLARWIERGVAGLSSIVLGLLAWHTLRLVLDERLYGSPAFAGLPAWPFQTIMPVAFAIMAVRYFLMMFYPVKDAAE